MTLTILQIPELLPRLESIEKNVYDPCTYCKYKPGEEDGGGGAAKSGGAKRGGGGGRKSGGKRGNALGGGGKTGGGKRGGSGGGNGKYAADIKAGKVPGQPGKDYPTFSLSSLAKKGNFKVKTSNH